MGWNDNTVDAMENLQPGDHFHEMFAHHVFVMERNDDRLKVLVAQAPCDLPRDGKVAELSINRFKKYYQYGGGETRGYWVTYDKRMDGLDKWLVEFDKLPIYKRFSPEAAKTVEMCECCKRPL